MHLSLDTKVLQLVDRYPFMLDYLTSYSPQFEKLRSPVARATIGRIATLRMAAALGKLPADKLLDDVRAAIERETGEKVESGPAAPAGADEQRERREKLKAVILDLHAGVDPAATRARFSELLDKVGATELGRLEHEIIQEGMPAEEVRRLCDLHVEVFKPSLAGQDGAEVGGEHPVRAYKSENRVIEKLCADVEPLLQKVGDPASMIALAGLVERLGGIDLHYQRKENQLFPYLEKKGVNGPSQVMWGVDDQIRAQLKQVREALAARDGATVAKVGPELVRAVRDMVFKEENILFPMSIELLDPAEWQEMRRGDAEIGFAFAEPAQPAAAPAPAAVPAGTLPMNTGALTLDQINLMLNHLPLEMSFVDANDEVRYYSRGAERIFPRSPAAIGRKVQNCHPPKSLHLVNKILDDFRAGTRDSAEFWIDFKERFVLIRYFAVRDAERGYQGCLEVTQDVTAIRKLEGQKRLLD